MKLYADRPLRLANQLLGDVLVVLVVYVCVRLGLATTDRVAALAGPGRDAEVAARDVDGRMRDAAGGVADAPLVGGALAKPFEVLAEASRDLASTAQDYQDAVADLARLAGILVAAAPILLLLAIWLPRRIGWVAEASAAHRLLRAGQAGADLLAVRALARQPLRRLSRVDPEVIRGWKADDPDATARLARLELDELGLTGGRALQAAPTGPSAAATAGR